MSVVAAVFETRMVKAPSSIVCTGHAHTSRAVPLPFIIMAITTLFAAVLTCVYFSAVAATREHVYTSAIFGRMQFRSHVERVGYAHPFEMMYELSSTAAIVMSSNFVLFQYNEHNVKNMVAVLEW